MKDDESTADIDDIISTLGVDDTRVEAETALRPSSPQTAALDLAQLPLLPVDSVAARGGELASMPPTAPPVRRRKPGGPDYQLRQPLGEGGMGIVYLAHQSSLDREVAVKSIKPRSASTESSLRLVQEALITGALEHPNVIPIYALGRDPSGAPLLVMKRVEGVSWRDMIRQPGHPHWLRLGVAQAEDPQRAESERLEWHLRVLIQVANAVDFAHQRGFIHRDLKPENVMIGSFGEVYVLDWGLGLKKSELASAGPSRTVVGTPAYMAPEMTRGDLVHLSELTDVYLLGATLHEVVTGKPPHQGTMRQAMMSAFHSRPPVFGPEVPRELAALISRAVAAAPADRFPSAHAFRQAVEQYLGRRGALALCEQALERSRELEALLAQASPGGKGVDPVALYRLFGECRFGFRQALRDAGDSEEARQGLEQAIIRMTRYELAQRHPEAAGVLMAELASPPAELVAQLEALKHEEHQQARELEELRKVEQDMDLNVGGPARAVAAATVAVTFLGLVAAQRAGGVEPSLKQSVIRGLGFVVILLVCGIIGRRRIFANQASRKLALSLFGGAVAVLAHRVIALHTQPSVATLFFNDLFLLGACSVTAAISHDRRWTPVAAWFYASSLAVVWLPQYAQLLLAGAVAGAMAVVAVAWLWPWKRSRPGS